jgi:hypothetical protein
MADPISLPKGYKRLGAFAIDEDSVFTSQAALDDYLANGTAYPGQLVALVLDGQNEVQVYKINQDKTTGAVGGGNVEVDAAPTENSENPVSSGGVFVALGNKAESNHAHETDTVPTQDSTKLVTSGGVFTELGKKAETNHTHARYEVFTQGFSFSGIDSFPITIGQKVRIDSIVKAANISELRAGKNGETNRYLNISAKMSLLPCLNALHVVDGNAESGILAIRPL